MYTNRIKRSIFAAIIIASFVLAGCGGDATEVVSTPTVDQEQINQIVNATLTASAAQMPTSTPPPPVPTAVPPTPAGAVPLVPTPLPDGPTLEAKLNTPGRFGPGDAYPVMGWLVGGRKVTLVGVSPDSAWYVVSVPPAPFGQGWVAAQDSIVTNADALPVIQPPPVPPTVEFTPPEPGDPQVVANDAVYVRSGPGNQYPAYGIAPEGSKGRLIGISEDGQWWVVRLNPDNVGKGNGWVSTSFVTAENAEGLPVIQAPAMQPVVPPPQPPEGAATATATDYVNIRSGPGTNYPVLIVAPPTSTGQITGISEDGQWYQVAISTTYSPDGFGWVNVGYVITSGAESVPVVPAPPSPPPPPEYAACVLVSQSPTDGTILSAGQPFDMVWQLQNTGTVTWSAASTMLQFVSAFNDVRLSELSGISLETDVVPGSTYLATVGMQAPGQAGTYGEVWAIVEGSTVLCQFYNIITVK